MEFSNDYPTRSQPTAEQLKHRDQLEEYRRQKRQRESRNTLLFKVAEQVVECWPCVALMHVRKTKAENKEEFAQFRAFLLQIAASEQYITLSSEIARRAEASNG